MAKINGKEVKITSHQSVAELLLQEGYDLKRVAVERNGRILPRKEYAVIIAESTDVFEVVHFVGGG